MNMDSVTNDCSYARPAAGRTLFLPSPHSKPDKMGSHERKSMGHMEQADTKNLRTQSPLQSTFFPLERPNPIPSRAKVTKNLANGIPVNADVDLPKKNVLREVNTERLPWQQDWIGYVPRPKTCYEVSVGQKRGRDNSEDEREDVKRHESWSRRRKDFKDVLAFVPRPARMSMGYEP